MSRWMTFAVAMLLSVSAAAAPSAEEKQQELEALRARIAELAAEVKADTRARSRVMSELQQAEEAAGRAGAELRRLKRELTARRDRLGELEAEQHEHRERLAAERDALEAQLRAAYRTGREEHIKFLLSQDDPARLGRMMAYYRYFTRARAERVEVVQGILAELRAVEAAIAEQAERIQATVAEQEAEVGRLEAARSDRREALAALEAEIAGHDQRLAKLRADEEALVELVRRLTSALADVPPEGMPAFDSLKDELDWPVQGRVLADFGDTRAQGRLRWRGMWIGADAGADVRAVAHGRVAYSDWLPGLGLLVVVEHGDGYLSLYGHNQTLYRSVGDWVRSGDVIAAVGDTGGQRQPGLYFEIRKGQQTLDPKAWMGTRLAER